MPRIPKYPTRAHKSGQARIKIRGVDFYLGPFGSEASQAEYARLIYEFTATGTVPRRRSQTNSGKTVAVLVAAFYEWAEKRYVKNGKPTSEIKSYRTALRPVFRLYGDFPTSDFDAACLMACRQQLIDAGYTRKRINAHVGRIRRVFSWGVPRRLVEPIVVVGLKTLEGLISGEAPDRPPITPVSAWDVLAAREYCLPPVQAMIDFQLLTACRPGEVCSLRTCDVQPSGKIWAFYPESHKTEHHNKSRMILCGPYAQELLTAWLRPDAPEAFVFSPKEGVEWRRSTMRKPFSRKRRVNEPKRYPGERYTVEAYSNAIRRSCKKAGVAHWHPNQLRHTAATLLRQQYGVETTRVILGHSRISTTELYAERDLDAASRAILECG